MGSIIRPLGLLGGILLAGCSPEGAERAEEAIPVVAETVRLLPEQTRIEAIDADRFVWVVVGDATVVEPQLEKLGLDVEVVQMGQ